MARPVNNLRLFVAIHPPVEAVRAMLALTAERNLPAHRNTPEDQVHMTVQFIGDTPAADMDETIESVARATAGIRVFALQPLALITLPERGPARLAAIETDQPSGLMELHRRLVIRLAKGARGRDAERFRPHLTMCRFPSPTSGVKLAEPLEMQPFEVNRITLMRGALSPAGALHREVAAFGLEA